MLSGKGHASLNPCDSFHIHKFGLVFGTTELPGGMLLIQTKGQICQSAAGYANLENKIAMKPKLIFPIASNTKMFTGAVVIQMINEEKLNLTDKAETYFSKKVFTLTRGIPNISEITILDLLRHSAGIRDYLSQPNLVNSSVLNPFDSKHQSVVISERLATTAKLINRPQEFLAQSRTFLQLSWIDRPTDQSLNNPLFILGYAVVHGIFEPNTFMPGTHAAYSNTNYLLLGDIIENVSELPIEQVFQKRIYKKLNLSHTFSLNRENKQFRLRPLTPYWGTKDFSDYYLGLVGYSDDGSVSTLSDLNRFVRDHAQNRLFFEDHQFLGSSFSTAIMIKEIGGEKVLFHTGEDPGFLSLAAYVPRCDASFVFMINQSDHKHGAAALQTIFLQAVKKVCEG